MPAGLGAARELADELSRDDAVAFAEPITFAWPLARPPDDPRFKDLWGLAAIHAPAAWLDRITDPQERQAALAIRLAGERAAALTAQMLAYAGRRDLGRREPVDLGALCRDLRELLDAVLIEEGAHRALPRPGHLGPREPRHAERKS